MANILKVSEAANLALRAATFIAANPGRNVRAREIVEKHGVSGGHLNKVMEKLRKSGIVEATRGPAGGFRLAKPAGKISLLKIYEAVEGKLEINECLFGRPVCGKKACILKNKLGNISKELRKYFQETRLSDLAEVHK